VGLLARNLDGLAAAAREIQATGSQAMMLPVDVADAAAVAAAADRVVSERGQIDIWVNDAMVSVFAPSREIRPDGYRRVMEVNYLGYVHGTLAALRHMSARHQRLPSEVWRSVAAQQWISQVPKRRRRTLVELGVLLVLSAKVTDPGCHESGALA
jgi:NAD(P)-dependent dehydrogenase (short-subunit alcohol dehydrogenase family)